MASGESAARVPCATCGEPVHFDGAWGWAHEEPARIYGHVAKPAPQEVTDA